MRVISGHDICAAAEQILREQLADVVTVLGWTDDLGVVQSWDHVPTQAALTTATLPAGLVTSPGLTSTPRRTSTGTEATWRIGVGVYVRGSSFTETARRTRRWAAAVRATLEVNRTLDGLARSTRWVGEEYRSFPTRGDARTLGGCAVAFDVDVEDVVDLTLASVAPTVESTHPSVTTRTPQE